MHHEHNIYKHIYIYAYIYIYKREKERTDEDVIKLHSLKYDRIKMWETNADFQIFKGKLLRC
jgi:hypothetical protein